LKKEPGYSAFVLQDSGSVHSQCFVPALETGRRVGENRLLVPLSATLPDPAVMRPFRAGQTREAEAAAEKLVILKQAKAEYAKLQ